MPETMNKEAFQGVAFDRIRIGLASPEKIMGWSRGEVNKPETTDSRKLTVCCVSVSSARAKAGNVMGENRKKSATKA